MAILTGNNGVVKIDNSSGTPTAIASVRNFSVEITRDTIETTTMGKDVRSYVGGLASFSGSADIYFDDANYTIELYLDTTSKKFAGEVIITGFTVNSTMDGMVEASISFQGSGDGSDIGIAYTA